MPLEPGSRLDAFELVALLGRGGMDEVWRAIDTTLARHVAVKRLPAEFIGDPLRVSRFEREARVASSLTHPNICHIYALGHAGGEQRYIAMEYVEGRTLRAQLHDSPFRSSAGDRRLCADRVRSERRPRRGRHPSRSEAGERRDQA